MGDITASTRTWNSSELDSIFTVYDFEVVVRSIISDTTVSQSFPVRDNACIIVRIFSTLADYLDKWIPGQVCTTSCFGQWREL